MHEEISKLIYEIDLFNNSRRKNQQKLEVNELLSILRGETYKAREKERAEKRLFDTDEPKLSETKVWTGEYRSFNYKITHHGYFDSFEQRDKKWFCYYIYFNEQQFSSEVWEKIKPTQTIYEFAGKKRITYDYASLEDLPFAGGVTWCEEQAPAYAKDSGEPYQIFEVGCDYNHSWNDGYETLSDILSDLKRTVDAVHELYNPLIRCKYTGNYYAPEDLYEAEGGFWVGKESLSKINPNWDAYKPKDETLLELFNENPTD